MARFVRDKTVRVVKSNGVDFYFFPSVNIDRTRVCEQGDGTKNAKAIANDEKDEIATDMDEIEDGMIEAMGFDKRLIDGAMNSSMQISNVKQKINMIVIRDTCLVDARKFMVTVKSLKKR